MESGASNPGRTCPKCGYRRSATETVPDWQCPKCGVAYAKVGQVYQPRARHPHPAPAGARRDQAQALPPEISEQQRLTIHAMLFVACFGIYAIFRSMWTRETSDGEIEFSTLLGSFALLAVLAALAFGAASWFQPRWRSRDAAAVAVAVWVVVGVGYSAVLGCPKVLLLLAFPFLPFLFGAMVGNFIGRMHHPVAWDAVDFDPNEGDGADAESDDRA